MLTLDEFRNEFCTLSEEFAKKVTQYIANLLNSLGLRPCVFTFSKTDDLSREVEETVVTVLIRNVIKPYYIHRIITTFTIVNEKEVTLVCTGVRTRVYSFHHKEVEKGTQIRAMEETGVDIMLDVLLLRLFPKIESFIKYGDEDYALRIYTHGEVKKFHVDKNELKNIFC